VDGAHRIHFSTGTGYRPAVTWTGPAFAGTTGTYEYADLDGDGKLDLAVVQANGTQRIGINQCEAIHLLTTVTVPLAPGLGVVTAFTYAPLTDASVHTRAPGKGAADFGAGFDEFPVVEVANAAHVVAHVAHSDGAGGLLEADYRYAGFAFHRQGRGSLGFAEVTVEDLDRKTRAVTALRQDFPFVGAVAARSCSSPLVPSSSTSVTA